MEAKKHPGLQVIDHWLKYQIAQGDVPGFQVSIRKDGQLVFSKAYGYANLRNKIKYTRAHVGRVASQSKVFTAALSLWLESQNIISLNDYLVDILTEFRGHRDPRFKKIKLIELLSHRSGIFRDSFDKDYWGLKEAFLSSSELIQEASAHPLVYKPGSSTKYSNIGYALLGLALERVTGESFNNLAGRYFSALGLNSPITFDYVGNNKLSQGYLRRQLQGQRFVATPHRRAMALAPAAGFCANTDGATDFFHRLYLTDTILPKNQRQALLNKKWPVQNMSTDQYGVGTIFSKVGGHSYLGHSGGFSGFSSQTWVVPKTKYAFGFMTNIAVTKTFNTIRGMAEIIQAVDDNFKTAEFDSLIVTKP